jgi:uncharacterized protein YjbI with pentapeptide repeats
LFISAVALPAWANDTENVNPSCKLEPEANCGWAELRKLNKPGLDMHDGQFMATRLDEAVLPGADLSGANMQLANLQKINLSGANLYFAHLHAVNLTNGNLQNANLEGTNFLDAVMRGANLKGAKVSNRTLFIAADLSGAVWLDGRTCAEGSKGECR